MIPSPQAAEFSDVSDGEFLGLGHLMRSLLTRFFNCYVLPVCFHVYLRAVLLYVCLSMKLDRLACC